MTRSKFVLRFLSTAQIMRLYKARITCTNPHQLSLLDSAAHSPQNCRHYQGQRDLFQLTGILGEKPILNHAYLDGNKRIGPLAVDLMLRMNGYQLQKQPFSKGKANRGLKNAHKLVAKKSWTSRDLAKYYRSIAKPINKEAGHIRKHLSHFERAWSHKLCDNIRTLHQFARRMKPAKGLAVAHIDVFKFQGR
jgi:prophage maintenance system killer protein